MVSAILRFRAKHAPEPSIPHWESRVSAPARYEALVRFLEWKLIEMPLPRLQTIGQSDRPFIFDIHWDKTIRARQVRRYQQGELRAFDNRVMFRPCVGEYFLQLNGLLRPLIKRRWAEMVAQLNRLPESELEMFLFGCERSPTARIRAGLWEIQEKRCFYCDARLNEPSGGEVNHFVPWSRYPDDALDNFVVADMRCNAAKSNSLAATDHLRRWTQRFEESSRAFGQLDDLAGQTAWQRHAERTLNVARAIYMRLPKDARLWFRGRQLLAPEPAKIARALVP